MTIDTQKLRELVTFDFEMPVSVMDAVDAACDHIDAQAADNKRLREALEWYASMSKQMGKAALNQDSQSILALMKEFAVDYGGRAQSALSGEGK